MRLDSTDTFKRAGMTETSTIPAALASLADAQIAATRIDDTQYLVDERFRFFPANGYWIARDGKSRGYGVRGLIFAVKASADV